VGRRGGGGDLNRKPLLRAFYDRPVLEVARDLLGRDVWHGGVVVRLTEVEAYRGADDLASHAYRGPTSRKAEGEAAAVLLRAGRVIGGAEIAASRRPGASARDLARGPARLTKALGIDGDLNGCDLARGPIRVLPGVPVEDDAVRTGPRVGVAAEPALPWRFSVADDPTVSVYRPAVVRVRKRPAPQP
jgi:DNA-3-methyladenine glycosylase